MCAWSLGRVQLFETPWIAARQVSLSFTISWILPKFMSIESMMLSNCLILCCPFSSCPQSFSASGSFPVSRLFISGSQRNNTLVGSSSSSLPAFLSRLKVFSHSSKL